MNFLKGTPFYSIFTGSCPVCQQESMYKNKNPFILKQLFEMNERCSHCNTKYKIEPSFFYGAMYVSYGTYQFYFNMHSRNWFTSFRNATFQKHLD